MRDFIKDDQLSTFWDDARRGAREDAQTGYLTDEWPDALPLNRFRGELAQVLGWIDRWQVPRGACLDVGCGTGVWLGTLARHFERAHGIDLSSEMVTATRSRLAAAGLDNVTVDVSTVQSLPASSQYDLIFVGGVLMYVNDEDVVPVLDRLGSMLTPNGLLILRESTHRGSTWYRDKPLARGLLAPPGGARAPYRAIYRPAEHYRRLLAERFTVRHVSPNRHYKLNDVAESFLWGANWLLGRRLQHDRAAAERAARTLYRLRAVTLYPPYLVSRLFARWVWKLENHWFVVSPPQRSVSGAAARLQLADGE